jgi:hypothetical protein
MDQLKGLMQPPQQTTAQNIGGMLQGLGAGFQGQPDPRLAQQDAQMKQKMQLMQIQQGVDKQRAQKSKMQVEIGREFLNQDSPEAKKVGARILTSQLKSMGVDVGNGVDMTLGSGKMTMDKLKQVTWAVRAQAPDKYLVETMGVSPNDLPTVKQMAASDEGYKVIFGKTPQQETAELQRSINDQRRVDLLEERGTREDLRMKLASEKDERLRAEGQRKLDLSERRVRVLEEQGQRNQMKLEYMLANGPEEKRLKALDHAELFVNQMQSVSQRLQDKGFLPKTSKGIVGGVLSGDSSALQAKAKRATDPNDEDWVTFTKHLKGDMIGYTRSVQNDIGPRAMAAFQGAFEIMDNPPSQDAVNAVIGRMRQAIDLSRKGADTAQTLYIRKPTGQIVVVPWKRGMVYEPGDRIMKVE